jgi:hypothetical protein
MDINVWAVVAGTAVMFAFGAVWYTALFSKLWSKIHGFDKLNKKEQDQMMKSMGPTYGLQLIGTIASAFVLTLILTMYPELQFYEVAFFLWLGFTMPAQVSDVLFGGTKPEWLGRKIAIVTIEALLRLLLAAWVVSLII